MSGIPTFRVFIAENLAKICARLGTRVDWALQMKNLVDIHYPEATTMGW